MNNRQKCGKYVTNDKTLFHLSKRIYMTWSLTVNNPFADFDSYLRFCVWEIYKHRLFPTVTVTPTDRWDVLLLWRVGLYHIHITRYWPVLIPLFRHQATCEKSNIDAFATLGQHNDAWCGKLHHQTKQPAFITIHVCWKNIMKVDHMNIVWFSMMTIRIAMLCAS